MRSRWLAGAALGAALGTLILGIGGRLAMRGIALNGGQPAAFSLGGSFTVVFMGMVWGLGGAVVFVAQLLWSLRSRRLQQTAVAEPSA